MNVSEAVDQRMSTRAYLDKPVSRETLETLLTKAQRAELLTAKHAVENATLTFNNCEGAIFDLMQRSAVIAAQGSLLA